jgi:iron complex outermembrane receptor protein
MGHRGRTVTRLLGGVAAAALLAGAGGARAADLALNIAPQPLGDALNEFAVQAKHGVVFAPGLVAKKTSRPVTTAATPEIALAQLLEGTGLGYRRNGDTFLIMEADADPQSGSAAGGGAEVEGLIVTAQKREENIQDVPIAMSAFSQETLEKSQIAGGPDLMTQVPNMTFTKTNFSSYSIQIRGIGTQAISATTDPAVAVAFNNTPFIRNRFFEQEFYDLQRLEVLRGPQGTLYGRNATAGVVNLISAKPKFVYEAKLSGDLGNYNSGRLEGMVNIPLVEDVVALRLASAWTKRDGYAINQMTGRPIDGRDLWSTRMSLRFEPTDWISANLIWEHFQEDDDRLRSGKQLCDKYPGPTHVNGVAVPQPSGSTQVQTSYLSQGCERVSLYSPEAFQTPYGFSLPFYGPTAALGNPVSDTIDPYLHATQSRDLRVIESSVEPDYQAKSDIAELQFAIDLTDTLTLNSETAYGADFLWSLQDYNRFTTTPGAFLPNNPDRVGYASRGSVTDENGVFCDPQLGCSDRVLLVDLSTERSTQFSQELRLASDFDGPFNFSLGANYLRHDAEAKYYVFINTISLLGAFGGSTIQSEASPAYVPGVTDNSHCMAQNSVNAWSPGLVGDTAPYNDPNLAYGLSFNPCFYIDPNPIGSLNDRGRNYFLSKNPYKLISYAAFGEAYYDFTNNLKVTAGFRFTVDRKTAPQIPSWLMPVRTADDYATAKTLFQEWREPTGRLALDWKPELSFTDETLLYASYAHGYKAGGANPPPPVLAEWNPSGSGATVQEFIPDTFGPEFVDAFELGTKNTLLDGALTLNLTGFYYDYKGYQVSEIRNRSAVNSNYDAEVWGLEIEADWRATEALKFGFKGGYNGTRVADGEKAIDLMDRTAGTPGWIVIRPFPTIPSNCIIPERVAGAGGVIYVGSSSTAASACVLAYVDHVDPVTGEPFDPLITNYVGQPCNRSGCDFSGGGAGVLGPSYADYEGFDPYSAPNNGQGFDKELGGNELPNAPNYTATVTADYTVPLRGDWLINLHADYHWQSESWWRIFNDHEYDRLDEFHLINIAAIFSNEAAGWKVMAYVKNVTDETALTGAFLNSDDTGLTTNVFLTEPRLYGLRVTKDFTGGGWLGEIGRCDNVCPVTVEIGGGVGRYSAETEAYAPAWLDIYDDAFPLSQAFQDQDLDWGDMRSVKVAYSPSADWRVSAAYRFGKANSDAAKEAAYQQVPGSIQQLVGPGYVKYDGYVPSLPNHLRAAARDSEEHEIIDFMVGRSVGFGALSAGLRHGDLHSTSSVVMDGVPNRIGRADHGPLTPFDIFTTSLESDRSFQGVGPFAQWDGSLRLRGSDEGGHADLDWTVGGGVLFGQQKTDLEETLWGNHIETAGYSTIITPIYDEVVPSHRSEDVTVPTLSLSLGLSYAIDRVKVSTGYSYDRFFDAIDAGYEESQTYDRTIQGPYLKLSLGFGG